MKRLLIDLPTLPEEGKLFSGELPPGIFDLPPKGEITALSPLSYELQVQRFGSELLFTGEISATFEFTCVRTLHPFTRTVHLPHTAISLEIGPESQIDPSEALREEILLHFPADPRCDEADEPMHCEIDPRYLAVDKPSEDGVKTAPRDEEPDRWSALDALKNLDPER